MRRAAAERDHELRANWMYDILNTYTAEQMVILDESSKDNRTLIRKYGRALSGDDPVLSVSLDRGTRYSILPALTLDGYIAARAVEGSINGEEFFDFIVNDLVCHSSQSTVLNDTESPLRRFLAPTHILRCTVSLLWITVQHIRVMCCGKLLRLLVAALYFCHRICQTSARLKKVSAVVCFNLHASSPYSQVNVHLPSESPSPSILLPLC